MSRIGKLPVEVPKGVKVKYSDSIISVEGPMGSLSRTIMEGVSLDISDSAISVVL